MSLVPYTYKWPAAPLVSEAGWRQEADHLLVRELPETLAELKVDSRWPGFFPSAMCLVTTGDGTVTGLEKVVGPSIVNRFPYLLSLSFCVQEISDRHHSRNQFLDLLERTESVAVQFIAPGPLLDKVMAVILNTPQNELAQRIAKTGMATRSALSNSAPVFSDAYLVYEGRFVKPTRDFQGDTVCDTATHDLGSHRMYLFEINTIQLRTDIAAGETKIHWQSLPYWNPENRTGIAGANGKTAAAGSYQKPYNPNYYFPASATVSFESDYEADGMAVKHLPKLPEDQVEVDNDRARWPCFFPSSAGMITTVDRSGSMNLMPCGSTAIVSRHPLTVAPCVCYCGINDRYAKRASLELIRKAGRFGCGVPFVSDEVLNAIRYAGNTSLTADPQKIVNCGLLAELDRDRQFAYLSALPVSFDCRVTGEIKLGTHVMFLGEVERVLVRSDCNEANPLRWYPWAELVNANETT